MADEIIQTSMAQQSTPEIHSGELNPELLSQEDQKQYFSEVKDRNKYLLEGLTKEERVNIANKIIEYYNDAKTEHETLCLKIDEWDEISRMLRKEVIGSDGEQPNYRSPLSFVTHEVLHSNVMNVFFSPQDPMRVIPTALDDIPKVNNISVFGNWSMKNEMQLFENFDILNHASIKNGESVAMVSWKKEYGIEIQRVPVKDEKGEIVYDEITQEPVFQEKEIEKLVYNAPAMEIINRKDYIQPKDCLMSQTPEWEAVILRMSYDTYLRDELQGKFYSGTVDMIKDWPYSSLTEVEKTNYEGDTITTPGWSKEFLYWFGRLRINVIKEKLQPTDELKAYELEDEFEVIVHIKSKTLSSIRKNRRPMKMRPFVNDYFIPDDTGRRAGIGVYEVMDSLQKCYDVMYSNFVYSTGMSNKPIILMDPTVNMRDEKQKIEVGYIYYTANPKGAQIFQFAEPNEAIKYMLDLVQQWAQFCFGISDYAAGMQSNIDPEASGKKVQLIVDQGNVRLNLIIKRKNNVLKKIFKMWFLLYRDNMPPNKFMRVAGEQNDPWKFEPISYEDFALQSIPDFELTGNVMNANKQLEANKAIAVFQMLIPVVLFNPATQDGLKRLTELCKWLVDKIGDAQLSRLIGVQDDDTSSLTPEEENAMMLQGEEPEPHQGEDIQHHLKVHTAYLMSPHVPEQIKPLIGEHIKKTLEMFKMMMAQQMAMQQAGMPPMTPGSQMQPPANSQPPQQPQTPNGVRPITNRPTNGQGMPINRMGNNQRVGPAGMPGQPGGMVPQ